MPVLPNAAANQIHAKGQATYRGIVQDAANAGELLMGKLVSAARLALQTREAASRDMHERGSLAQSAKLLRQHESDLCKRYPAALLEAFANPEGPKKAAVVSMDKLQFDQLELMDEVTVMTSVALARTQQVAMLASEVSLSDLNTLICSLLGLSSVRPERNPLRPEIYVKALKDTVESTHAPASTQLDWISTMSATLGQELRAMYVSLCQRLRSDGVVSATFSIAQAPLPLGVGRGIAQQAGTAQVSQGGTNQALSPEVGDALQSLEEPARLQGRNEVLLTLDKLRRLLSGELEAPQPVGKVEQFAARFAQQFEDAPAVVTEPQRGPDFDATVPAALEALTEMRQVERVVQSLEQRRNAPPSAGSVQSMDVTRHDLRRNVRDIAQALSLEVVTLMVDNMARDPRLLGPVQQLLRNLEPALLRLVLVDPRFFTDKQHCARQLLQDITHGSLAFSSVKAEGFEVYFQSLQEAVEPLRTATIDSAEPFEKTLAVLREGWGRIERIKEKGREVAVEVLKHAEARNLLAEKIARGIDAHPDSKRVPTIVIDFLCGPWAQVVAQARIKGGAGSAAADKFQALITAMLWSAHPELARQSSAKLTRLVPKLLSTLREGLDTINYPATKTSAFLEALMAIHQVAFRGGAPSAEARLDKAASPQATRLVEDGNPWIAPEEAISSNFIDIEESQDVAAPAQEPASASDPGPDSASRESPETSVQPSIAVDGDLPIGSWVELMTNSQWVRTQLTWASPHGTLFLFTSAFGTTQSMTRRSRDKLVQAGKLRLVSGHAVVEVALDGVAQAAMRNSVQTTL